MRNILSKTLVGAALIANAGVANGQTALGDPSSQEALEPSAATGVSDDIVVTAQKRSESLQDVPIAISAFTSEQLQRRQIQGAADLRSIVPNLQISSPFGESLPIFSMRGVTQTDFSLAQNGPIAIYYDEAYKGSFAIQGVGLFDLERIEVLKGPQGTLYGKNTTGGAINLIARKPDFTDSANISASYGNFDALQIEGGAQAAISDTLAVRAAFTFARAQGFIDNLALGRPDLNSTRQYAIRGTLLYKPSDAFSLTIRAATSFQNPTPFATVPVADGDGVGSPFYPAFGADGTVINPITPAGLRKREAYDASLLHQRARTYSLAAMAEIKLTDSLSLVSITSWDKGSLFLPYDTDGTSLDLATTLARGETKQISQDLRLVSDFTGPFNFILGGYYNREKMDNGTTYNFFADIDVNRDAVINAQDCIDGGFFPACQFTNRYDQKKTSLAGYADASYELSDKVKLHAGLRYTRDNGDFTNFTAVVRDQAGNDVFALLEDMPQNDRFFRDTNLSGKIGIDFKVNPDILLYATASSGFRGAAFNGAAFFGPAELTVTEPETLKAYEIGFKTDLFDRLVRFNGAIFYYDYKNQQTVDYDSETQAQVVVNLDKSRVLGAEFDLAVRPTDNLTLTSSLGLLDSKIKRATARGVDISGNHSVNSPTVTLSSGFDWDMMVSDTGTLQLHGDATYTSKQYYDIFNNATTVQGDYIVVNGRVRFAMDGGRYGIAIWGKNITNAFFYTLKADAAAYSYTYTHVNPPSTFGVSFDAKF